MLVRVMWICVCKCVYDNQCEESTEAIRSCDTLLDSLQHVDEPKLVEKII